MGIEAVSWALNWDPTAAESVAVGHRWVLSVMQKNGPALVTMLWRILGNEQDVCDVYQETFLQLARCRNGPVPDNPRAFVFRCAANKAVSAIRRRRRQTLAHQRAACQAPQMGRDMDAQQLRETLRAYLTRLPDKLRDVMLLKDLGELPYEQVAGMLGMSVATARVYRCRAIRLLSGWMARREEDWL